MNKSERNEIMLEANRLFGESFQVDLCIEECSELIKALLKHRRYRTIETLANVSEELADVRIMVEQIINIFDIERSVKDSENFKMARQLKRNLRRQDDIISMADQDDN